MHQFHFHNRQPLAIKNVGKTKSFLIMSTEPGQYYELIKRLPTEKGGGDLHTLYEYLSTSIKFLIDQKISSQVVQG